MTPLSAISAWYIRCQHLQVFHRTSVYILISFNQAFQDVRSTETSEAAKIAEAEPAEAKSET